MNEADCEEWCQEYVATRKENLALDDEVKELKAKLLKCEKTLKEIEEARMLTTEIPDSWLEEKDSNGESA